MPRHVIHKAVLHNYIFRLVMDMWGFQHGRLNLLHLSIQKI